ncbi:3-beta hydroxysteroid dehydrogenase [Roseateles aquatilis]|uniref:3-beta hydroxysteroid dehydrogenase n=1 Tax=Roseateles aquatilis TaxID=431061 RepID=A0A246ITA5_9BURK|nr:NAD(P)-dependent oxidoreductase [Roseateles aquatilis]OWQ83207.1 3-beta hydroxysteroid dehydrogenase [Roseateles aquatilis]
MKVALIGPTGFVGSEVLKELLARGHEVIALARDPSKLQARPGLTVRQADVKSAEQVATAVGGADAVVSAYNPGWSVPNLYDEFLAGTRATFDGVKRAGVKRFLMVGGAGSLYAAPGVQIVDTPEFPEQWKAGALAAREALNLIRHESALDWTFLSPAVHLEPGERRGSYRVSLDTPVMDANGPAHVSTADLAVAIVDELERPQHIRRRFTVGY